MDALVRIPSPGKAGPRLVWELRRAASAIKRRVGLWPVAMLASSGLAGLLAWSAAENHQRAQDLQVRADVLAQMLPAQPPRSRSQATQDKLDRFEAHLLPAKDIPSVVEDVLRLAEEEGLAIRRGEYRAQADTHGGFMRYGMALPVSGNEDMVRRFLRAALYRHKYIALQSIEFKRERIETDNIEARLQFVILSTLPEEKARAGHAKAEGKGAA